MKRIVVIGANNFQRPLILKARLLGYETHVFAWKDGAVGANDADFFYPISIIEKEKILNFCKKIKPDAIVSIGSDLASITVNYIANALNLTGNSLKSTKLSTNKLEMREALKKAGLNVPAFKAYSAGESISFAKQLKYPVIVKPVDRSGSRGVTKVENSKEINTALKKACNESFEKKAIIEEFVEGAEYSCECISFKGKHHILAFTKKFTTGYPNFIETGHIEPSGLEEKWGDEIKLYIHEALDALGIQNGASHSEFKIEKGDVKIIEIGGRMGGDCIGSHLVELSTGYDFVKLCLDVALGIEPDIQKKAVDNVAAIKFIFNKEDINFYNILKKKIKCNIVDSYIEDLSEVKEISDSSTRWGYYIMRFETLSELKEIGLYQM